MTGTLVSLNIGWSFLWHVIARLRSFEGKRDKNVLLVNERTTSGKEMYTYAFRKHVMGDVVGRRTAGAVMAGSPRLLKSGNLLYLAVMDVEIDGQRLEGVGVEPTVSVERPPPYAAGADPQLDAALKTAVTQEATQPSTLHK